MISNIKQQHMHLGDNEFIKIRLVEDIDINISKNDDLSCEGNVLIIRRTNRDIIVMVNPDKIIMTQKRSF